MRIGSLLSTLFVLSRGKPKSINRIMDVENGRRGTIVTKGRIGRDGNEKDTKVRVVPEFSVRTNIWRYHVGKNGEDNPTGHPAVFPIRMAYDHIVSWSNPGDLVVDPFGGSGTTAIAAIQSGRRWICIERDPGYFNAAIARVWEAEQKLA